ncbi:type II toxin-antitoxin system RelE family toxin [Methylococcus mesophilus]|uniref:type II toxin-antitoxin system RelE family toxin n=1 Tax=Methylococcus mesophilus TaxID=2993564 RepID=UPI00224AA9D0|nr:type II toxin-antitoxin system RelE/ParE family toxin [Methylococcus mesophilus]UZR30634.1 type II toxin-antitoxin system RelE/ParE family toxin [Methylococcus mesophilus]
MAYEVVLKPSAKKTLDGLPRQTKSRIVTALEGLAENPRHHGVIKLESEHDLYRVRIGSYRAVFTIEDDRLVVLVLKIGNRREVYR